jgi:hypothetical protein
MLIETRLKLRTLIIISIASLIGLHIIYLLTEVTIIKSNLSFTAKKFAAEFDYGLKTHSESKISEILNIMNDPVFFNIVFRETVTDKRNGFITPLGYLDKTNFIDFSIGDGH